MNIPTATRINAVNPGVTVTQLHRSGGMDEETYAAFLEHTARPHTRWAAWASRRKWPS
jgi:hypothetical protein